MFLHFGQPNNAVSRSLVLSSTQGNRTLIFSISCSIYIPKELPTRLFFFRFFRVETWNPEYPFGAPTLLCEKRMSFLLLTLAVSPEVELIPRRYKEASSYVQQ